MSNSIVLTFQKKILDSHCPVSECLRYALAVSSKLNQKENEQWILNELKGYDAEVQVPDYRSMEVTLLGMDPFSGKWQPVLFGDQESERSFQRFDCRWSIPRIEDLKKNPDSRLAMPLPGHLSCLLSRITGLTQDTLFARKYAHHQLESIENTVRDRLLQWSLALEEKGVLGNELKFSPQEKSEAQSIVIYNSGPIGAVGTTTNSTISQVVSSDVRTNDWESLAQFLSSVGVSNGDIDSLQNAVNEDRTDNPNGVGHRVLSWLKSLPTKLADAAVVDLAKKAVLCFFGIDL